ncbi:MAG: acyl-CoA dehydrogenase, partial [Actinobacteria bacterium]|nr:acyl-CoA dehydrogenase [Actinomycetota bacterium]
LDRLPLISVLSLVASGTAVGSAERVLELFEERTRSRIMAYSLGDKAIEQPSPRMHLAAQSAAIDAARSSWQRAIDDLEATAQQGEPSLAQRAHARLTAANAVRSCRVIIGDLLAAAGASIYNINSPMQRYQRDVEVLKGHAVFDWDRTTELAGRVMLDLELGLTDMV